MLTARIIPCLDVAEGRVVKGVNFQDLRDAGDPVDCAARYEADGADELVMLDVKATPANRGNALETVRAVRRVLGIPLTVGGGVRSAADAEALLEAGADKVGVNSASVERPELLTELSDRFGAQATVCAIDAARREGAPGFELVVRGGRDRTGIDALAWASEVTGRGAGEILLTSWDRDGTGEGYDLELLQAVSSSVDVPVIASGGASRTRDLVLALTAGASAVLAASIFHDDVMTVETVKRELAEAGIEVRP